MGITVKADSYVYIIFRPDGRPCYVGKGRGDRFDRTISKGHNLHLTAIAKGAGGELPKLKVREGLTDAEARETEIAFIAAIGREAHGGPLINQTDGGDGTAGAKMTPEWRAHRAQKAREVWAQPGRREAASQKWSDNNPAPKTRSAEHRSKIGAAQIGNQHTLGFQHSEESKAKMSLSRRGVPKSPEHRAAISAAHLARRAKA